jgi:two-component system response regulator
MIMEQRIILLIEDNPSDVKLTQRALNKNNHLGCRLIVARDGQEALDLLFGDGPLIPDLVLLDLKLPKVDGLRVLERIRAVVQTRMVPVVILTTSKEEQDRKSAYTLGVNSYIVKPIDFNNFVETINQIGSYWMGLNEPPPAGGCGP